LKFKLKNYKRSGEIEQWLNGVQDQMKETISKRMRIGRNDLESKESDRKKWVLEHPGQIIATISHVFWCSTTEEVLDQIADSPAALLEWLSININQLSHLTELVRTNLEPIKHKIVVALITQDVHARDILEMMVNEGVAAKGDFLWQQQLRYYWDEGGEKENVFVLQVNAKLKYGYEYMGATSRLV
jgi:dynein heavy chain